MSLNILNTTRVFDMNPVLKAMLEYNQTYDLELAYYDALALKLGELKSAVLDTTEAKAIYDLYLNDLETATDVFSRGRNINTAVDLGKLRRQYGLNIVPLEEARSRMLENIKRVQDLTAKDPTMISLNIGTLDDYYGNPTYTTKNYSGATIMNDVSNMAKILSQASATISSGQDLDAFTKTFVKQYGMSASDVQKAINELRTTGTINNDTLWNMVDSAVNTSGVKGWGTDNLIRTAYEWAGKGLNSAIGKQDVGTYANKEAEYNRQLANSLALENARARHELLKENAKNALKGINDGLGLPINTDRVPFGADSSKAKSAYNKLNSVLGISTDSSTGNTTYNTIKLSTKVPDTTPRGELYYREVTLKNESGKNEFKVFRDSSNKELMTRSEFIAQGADLTTRLELAKYYDGEIMPAIRTVGASANTNAYDITSKANLYLLGEGAAYTDMISVNFGKTKNLDALNSTVGSYITQMGGAYELTSDASDFKKGSKVKLEDIQKKAENEMLSYHISKLDNGRLGLVITAGNTKYFIPKENMGSLANEGWNFEPEQINRYLLGAEKLIKEANDKLLTGEYNEVQYYKALRFIQDAYEQNLISAGAGSLTKILTGIFGEYEIPKSKLLN